MKKVPIDDVKEGEVLAADIFDSSIGGDLPLLSRSVVLTADYIKSLRRYGITELFIVTPPGYRGKPGEVLAPSPVTGHILFDGGVEIDGPVPPDIRIEAGEGIRITGDVGQGCVLTSASGGITIQGSVKGTAGNRVRITAARDVLVDQGGKGVVAFADVKTVGSITANAGVQDCSLSARGKISISGATRRSQVYTQTTMKLGDCGDTDEGPPCVLIVKPHQCRALYQELLRDD
ncbi:MAG: FapA family protein, partial [Thermodesulfobacteriota bacterium]